MRTLTSLSSRSPAKERGRQVTYRSRRHWSTTRRSARRALLTALLTLVALTGMTALPVDAAVRPAATSAQPAATTGNYYLHFRNLYKDSVSVAIMYRDDSGNCDGYGGWATRGWWNMVNRGDDVQVLTTPHRYVYYYAYSWDGSDVWTADSPRTDVDKSHRFDSCYLINKAGWVNVGMRRIDMGPDPRTYTYSLLP
jgi:uncharacterized membrane protein